METPDDQAAAERFCEVLGAQRSSYERLEELAREQSELIRDGSTEQLLETLQRRQLYLDDVQEHEQELRDVKQNWPDAAAGWPVQQRRRAEAMFAEIKRLLEQITASDRQDMQALQAQRLGVSRQIQRFDADARTTRRINQSYAASAYGPRKPRMDLTR